MYKYQQYIETYRGLNIYEFSRYGHVLFRARTPENVELESTKLRGIRQRITRHQNGRTHR